MAGVGVVGDGDVESGGDVVKASEVLGELVGVDGDVFDDGYGLGGAFVAVKEGCGGFSCGPDTLLKLGRGNGGGSVGPGVVW